MVSIFLVGVGLHIDKVDDTTDVFFKTDWKVNGESILRETLVNRVERLVEVATDLVNFVNKTEAWHAVFGSLAPNSFGLSFDTHLTVENGNSTIEHTKRAFYFGGKVDVARGIDNVNFVTFPSGGNSCGSNGNTTFLFLFHPVSSSTTGVTLDEVDFVLQASTVEDSL